MKKDSASTELLEVNLLQLFVLLYTTRSVNRAAEQLGLAQPTVSIRLSKLRKVLKDPLFVRTNSGMQPTSVADALISAARETLESLHRISSWESKFDPAMAERRFCICMSDVANITLLPQILAKVRAVAPHVRLEAARIDKQTGKMLESGEADLAIGLLPELGAGFFQQSLFTQDWVCLVSPKHPRIRNELSLASYQKENHINIVSGTGHHLLDNALENSSVERHVVLELPGFLGLSVIVSSTDLVATVSRQMGEALAKIGNLQVFPCPFPIPSFTVKQHWHTRYHHDAGNRWLRNLCAELFLRKK